MWPSYRGGTGRCPNWRLRAQRDPETTLPPTATSDGESGGEKRSPKCGLKRGRSRSTFPGQEQEGGPSWTRGTEAEMAVLRDAGWGAVRELPPQRLSQPVTGPESTREGGGVRLPPRRKWIGGTKGPVARSGSSRLFGSGAVGCTRSRVPPQDRGPWAMCAAL